LSSKTTLTPLGKAKLSMVVIKLFFYISHIFSQDSGLSSFLLPPRSCSVAQGWRSIWDQRRWGEGIVREFGMDRYTLLYLRWITNKDLL